MNSGQDGADMRVHEVLRWLGPSDLGGASGTCLRVRRDSATIPPTGPAEMKEAPDDRRNTRAHRERGPPEIEP